MDAKKLFNRGFSLIEILMVIGLLGGVSLVVMSIGKLSNKSSVKLQMDTDITLTTNEINSILSDPTKCLATLASTATPTSINGKFFTQGSGSAPADGYGNSKLNIVNYNLTTTGNDGVLTILYENKNILKGSSGPTSISKKINLFVEGSPGAIAKCRSLSTAASDIWVRTGNDINYNNGNVGIGATLEVAGGVKVGDMLEATGGVQIGAVGADASTTCASPIKAGTTRYNLTTDKMEFCNKTGTWVAFGSSAPPPAPSISCTTTGNCISCTKTITSCAAGANCGTAALVVPSSISGNINYTLVGGGSGNYTITAVNGATVTGSFAAVSGNTLDVYVGGGGGGGNNCGSGGAGWYGGGAGGGGGGGGSTAVLKNGILVQYASGGGASNVTTSAAGMGVGGSDTGGGSSGEAISTYNTYENGSLGKGGGTSGNGCGGLAPGGTYGTGGINVSGTGGGRGGGYGGGGGGASGAGGAAGGDGGSEGANGIIGAGGPAGIGSINCVIGSTCGLGGNSYGGGNGGKAILTYTASTCSM